MVGTVVEGLARLKVVDGMGLDALGCMGVPGCATEGNEGELR